jgi:hypothetical protein
MEMAPLGLGTDPGQQLSLLAGTNDGCNDNIHAIRNQPDVQADLVQAVVSDLSGSVAGIGYVWQPYYWNNNVDFSPYAFSLVERGLEVYSGTHEMGHNLGCNHNPENAVGATPIFPWGFGHSAATWRTQMSYGTFTQTRIPYFSNPDIQYNSQPIGIPGARDNSRLLRDTIPIAANWRGVIVPPPLPQAVSGLTATQNLIARINLNWNAAADAANYQVFRNATCNGTPITTVSTTQMSDSATLATDFAYDYSVRSANITGTSACSVAVVGKALPKTTPVYNLSASDSAFPNKIQLTWDAVDSDATVQLQLFRTNSASAQGCLAANQLIILPAIGTTYSDNTAVAGVAYRYSMLRNNLDGTSSDCSNIDEGQITGASTNNPQTSSSLGNTVGGTSTVSNNLQNDTGPIVQSVACGRVENPQGGAMAGALSLLALTLSLLVGLRFSNLLHKPKV